MFSHLKYFEQVGFHKIFL